MCKVLSENHGRGSLYAYMVTLGRDSVLLHGAFSLPDAPSYWRLFSTDLSPDRYKLENRLKTKIVCWQKIGSRT